MDAQFTSINPEELRRAMRHWPTGVAVASSLDGETRHGMTVNSFASVSLDPPLISVAMAKITQTFQMTRRSGVFGITILNQDQKEISDRFAGRDSEHQDRFAGLETFTLATGVSFLVGGLAFLDCQVAEMVDVGVNTVVIGRVVASSNQEHPGEPLLYFNRSYHQMGR